MKVYRIVDDRFWKVFPAVAGRLTVTRRLSVDAAVSEFSGIVTCDTLIAKGGGVVSPTYTPGLGNVW